MKKTVRLTESDLMRIVKKVIKEQEDLSPHDAYNERIHTPWKRLSAGQKASSEELSDMLSALGPISGEIESDDRLGERQKETLMMSLDFIKDFLEHKMSKF